MKLSNAPLLVLLIVLAAAASAAFAGTYGDGVQDAPPTPIADILADPEGFAGKAVVVEGKVTGVCPKKGCWMELTDDAGRLRVKVEDDVIVFPREAEGKRAVAAGTVQLLAMDRERYVGWMRHLAEELGEPFDESSIGEPPYRIVQIAGTGATISD